MEKQLIKDKHKEKNKTMKEIQQMKRESDSIFKKSKLK